MIVFDIVRMLRTVILMMPIIIIIGVVVIIIVNCNYYFNSVQHT